MYWVDNRSSNDPYLNLAIEEYLVRNIHVDRDILFLYINSDAVVLGKNQCVWMETNLPFLKTSNIKLARRVTGGGTVFHDKGNLNYSVISPFNDKILNRFSTITKPVIDCIEQFGVQLELNKHNDLIYQGYKISGTAQFTNRKNIISHGTLLVDSNLENLSGSLKTGRLHVETKAIPSKRSKVANIRHWAEGVTAEGLISDLKKAYGVNEELKLTEQDWESINDLKDNKYGDQNWIVNKSPDCKVNFKLHKEEKIILVECVIESGILLSYRFMENGEIINENVNANLELNSALIDTFSDDLLNDVFEILT